MHRDCWGSPLLSTMQIGKPPETEILDCHIQEMNIMGDIFYVIDAHLTQLHE